MGLLDELVERRIAAAEAKGDLRDLPGSGRPLALDDEDPLTPVELRLANRILKNAGFAPPAVTQLGESRRLRREWAAALQHRDEAEQRRLQAKLLALDCALESARGAGFCVLDEYARKVAETIAGARGEGREQDSADT